MGDLVYIIDENDDFSIEQISKKDIGKFIETHLVIELEGGLEIIYPLEEGKVYSIKGQMSVTDHEGKFINRFYKGFHLVGIRYNEYARTYSFDLISTYVSTGILNFYVQESENINNIKAIVEGLKVIKTASEKYSTVEEWAKSLDAW